MTNWTLAINLWRLSVLLLWVTAHLIYVCVIIENDICMLNTSIKVIKGENVARNVIKFHYLLTGIRGKNWMCKILS